MGSTRYKPDEPPTSVRDVIVAPSRNTVRRHAAFHRGERDQVRSMAPGVSSTVPRTRTDHRFPCHRHPLQRAAACAPPDGQERSTRIPSVASPSGTITAACYVRLSPESALLIRSHWSRHALTTRDREAIQ